MLDPLTPLFQAQRDAAGFATPGVADPTAAGWLADISLVFIAFTAAWAIGGMIAGVWPPFARVYHQINHHAARTLGRTPHHLGK